MIAGPVVVVPVYRREPTPLERFSIAHSLAQLAPGRRVVFVGPQGLDPGAWREACGPFEWRSFDAASFASIAGYSRLLMSVRFYGAFAEHEFMLVLQTDALVLHDALDDWCAQPYDYIGAPWPDGVEVRVGLDRFAAAGGLHVKALVGNGGLSLRRNRACIDLLQEFPQALDYFHRSGSSEDLFFSILGAVSSRFLLPNPMVAARFALELQPGRYQRLTGTPPMGGHAWWKYEPDYWLAQLGAAAEAVRPLLPPVAIRRPATSAALVQTPQPEEINA